MFPKLFLSLLFAAVATAPAASAQAGQGLTREKFDAGPPVAVATAALSQLAAQADGASDYHAPGASLEVPTGDLKLGWISLRPHIAGTVCERQILWLKFEGPPGGRAPVHTIEPLRPGEVPPPQGPLDPPRRAYRIAVTNEFAPIPAATVKPPRGYAEPVDCGARPPWFVAPSSDAAERALAVLEAVSSRIAAAPPVEACHIDGRTCASPSAALLNVTKGRLTEARAELGEPGDPITLNGLGADGRVWRLVARTKEGSLRLSYDAAAPLPDSHPGWIGPHD